MADRLTTLEEWAKKVYGDKAPTPATLRRWAREARIVPLPRKHGRTYFVYENAVYQEYQ